MQTMTGYKKKQQTIYTPLLSCGSVHETANEFNRFYARFDTGSFSEEIARQCAELERLNQGGVTPP